MAQRQTNIYPFPFAFQRQYALAKHKELPCKAYKACALQRHSYDAHKPCNACALQRNNYEFS